MTEAAPLPTEESPSVPWWRRITRHHAADAAAVLVLLASLVHLAGFDQNGGLPIRTLAPVVAVALLALPALVPELARLSRRAIVLVVALSAAPVLAAAIAPIRAGMTRPLLVSVLGPLVFLAGRRIWRRSWGPAAVGAIITAAALRNWYMGFLIWWGGAPRAPQWLSISWHNQAGTLMGALGVAAAAVAATTTGRVRVAAVAISGPLLAAMWLSGSRGALVATIAGFLVAGLAAWRASGARHALVSLAAAFGATLLMIVALTAMTPSDAGQPITARDQSAAGNLIARVGHWEAAVGMFVERPLTGHGPGSYRWAARAHYPEDTNLTTSAHSEYLEAFAEGGLLWGLPMALTVLALGWFGLVAIRDRGQGREPIRHTGRVAATAGLAVLLPHAAIDFDHDFAIIVALTAVLGAILHAEHAEHGTSGSDIEVASIAREAPDRTGAAWVAGGSTLLALATIAALASAWPIMRSLPPPWNLEDDLQVAANQIRTGDIEAAEDTLDRVSRWNRGSTSLVPMQTIVAHERGDVDTEQVVAVMDPQTMLLTPQLFAMERLIAADETEGALRISDGMMEVLPRRTAWGVSEPSIHLVRLRIEAKRRDEGCVAAQNELDALAQFAEEVDADLQSLAEAIDECELTSRIRR